MKTKIFVILFVILCSIRFWSFQGISQDAYLIVDVVVIALMFLYCLTRKKKIRSDMYLSKYVILLFVFVFLSMLPANYVHGQSYYLSFLVLRFMGYYLFYYVLHYLNVDTKTLLNIVAFVGVVWAFLLIVQQRTYPTIWFYTRGLDLTGKKLEIRNGLYRFNTLQHLYGSLSIIYFFILYFNERKTKYMVIALWCLVGLYVFSTRQYLLATVVGMIAGIFLLRGRSRYLAIALSIIIVAVVAINLDALFGEQIAKTQGQLNSSNIRVLAYKFFLFKFWGSPICYFFGNGVAHELSHYGYIMANINAEGLYQADIGIVGTFNKFGIFYVIVVFALFYKIIMRKTTNKNLYIRIFGMVCLLILPLSDFFTFVSTIPFLCILFYLFDKTMHEENVIYIRYV